MLAAATAALIAPVAASAQTELKLLSGFDNRYAGVELIVNPFTKGATAASNGRLTFKVSGPEVVRPNEQFEPVSRGVFDILFTVTSYFLGTSATSFGIYALEPLPEEWRKNGVFDFVDKDFALHNLKLLSIISGSQLGNGVYQIMLKEQLSAAGDLKGRKIRGNRNYAPIVEPLGGSLVNLAGGEIYAALQNGVVDGAAWPIIGAVDFKWYEQAKYMMRPNWGYSYHFILMNLDRFNRLADADKKALIDEGAKIEITGMKEMDTRQDKEIVDLKRLGVQETTVPAASFDKLLANFGNTVWQIAEEHRASAAQVRAFRELVKTTKTKAF